jgi:hypothetical protein
MSSCPGATGEQHPFTVLVPGDQPPAAPVNDLAPSVVGTAVQGHILSGFAGGWNASPPPLLSTAWTRCDPAGENCVDIDGASSLTYVPTADDAGSTIRLVTTASNLSGTVVASSAPTPVVAAGPPVAQFGNTSTGFTSVEVDSTATLASTFTAPASGTATDFEFYARGAATDQTFVPRVYSVANGRKGSLLATGTAVLVPRASDGNWHVSHLGTPVALKAGRQYVLELQPSGSFNGSYVGSEPTGVLCFFLDYTP